MYKGYKIICVTPAGRRRFLDILSKYTLNLRHIIDEHHLWLNTNDQEDIAYIQQLEKRYPDFFKVILPTVEKVANHYHTINQFFHYCTSADTIYLRFDDDVCYMTGIEQLLNFHCSRNLFMSLPLILNNEMTRYMPSLRNLGKEPRSHESHVWNHQKFLDNKFNYFTDHHILYHHEAVSINAFCWFGRTFAKFKGVPLGENEEDWLVNKAQSLGLYNGICGQSLVVHFAFHDSFDWESTNFLKRYEQLAKNNGQLMPQYKIY